MSDAVPFADLKAQYASIADEVDSAVRSVIASQQFIGGPTIERFETQFSTATDAGHTVAVDNGTAAISLALEATGIGWGDEVIVPAMTFAATAEAVCHVGAAPVFADVDPETFTLDPSSAESLLGPRTRAIIPVHLYGNPCDMDALQDAVAASHDLVMIEDCAQAHLAKYGGKAIGSFGLAATYSFFPGKNLGAYGDAGAVTTDSAELAGRIRLLRDHGRSGKYVHETIGYNHRMDTIQAAVLLAKLPHLRNWTETRKALAERYRSMLSEMDVRVMAPTERAQAVYHLFPVEVSERRDAAVDLLRRYGINIGVHYPVPLHEQPAFASCTDQRTDLSVAERIAEREISLPLFPELQLAQLERVVATLQRVVDETRT